MAESSGCCQPIVDELLLGSMLRLEIGAEEVSSMQATSAFEEVWLNTTLVVAEPA